MVGLGLVARVAVLGVNLKPMELTEVRPASGACLTILAPSNLVLLKLPPTVSELRHRFRCAAYRALL